MPTKKRAAAEAAAGFAYETAIVPLAPATLTRIASLMGRMKLLNVETSAARKLTADWLADLIATKVAVKEDYEPEYRKRKAHFEAVQEERNAKIKMLERAEAIIRPKLIAWEQAERVRIENERLTQIETEQKRLAKAIKRETGETVDPKALTVPEPIIARAEPIPGQAYVENWQGECLDVEALVREAAANPALLRFLEPCDIEIRNFAKLHKATAQARAKSLALRFFDAGSYRVSGKGA